MNIFKPLKLCPCPFDLPQLYSKQAKQWHIQMLQWSLPGPRAEFLWGDEGMSKWNHVDQFLGLGCYLTKFLKRRSFTVTARNQHVSTVILNTIMCQQVSENRSLHAHHMHLVFFSQRHLYIPALFWTICEPSFKYKSSIRPCGETQFLLLKHLVREYPGASKKRH